ncbi:MAG: S9 family peptidase [archaeon]|nr:S9 family peptidase [archaeon]
MNKYILLLLISFVFSQKQNFTATDLHTMKRLTSSILSVDGKYVIYTESQWTKESGKTVSTMKYKEVNGKESFTIGESIGSPVVSSFAPNHLFFSKGGQIHYINFPPKEGDESVQLTNYPISINTYKIGYDSIVFTADVFFNCTDFECTAALNEIVSKQDYKVYDSLFAFHWDKWLDQGKGSRIFLQKIEFTEDKKIQLKGTYRDLTNGMKINVPFLNTGKDNYDVSKDGKMAAYSGLLRTHDEAWNTSWKTYFIIFDEMIEPLLITGNNAGRTQNPVFNIDGTKIAFLSMKTPILESENLHLEIYNILRNKIDIVSDKDFDLSIESFTWINDHSGYITTTKLGLTCLFKIDFKNTFEPTFEEVKSEEDNLSYGTPFTAINNRKVFYLSKSGYNLHPRLVRLDDDSEIINVNPGFEDKYYLSKQEKFTFKGAKNEDVQGWMLKPNNFDESKKYSMALLIHGGPESSWSSDWSYRWNPQLWVNEDHITVMFNIHGSQGVSTAFREAVRRDWGGAPYEDIKLGLKYLFDTYSFIDKEKVCACGGSYGGYMVTWLQGHPDILEGFKFKCLVSHDGAFSLMSKSYATDEIWFQKSSFCPASHPNCQFYEEEAREIVAKNSPERFVDKWSIPMLLIQGGIDYRVPTTEALSAFTALKLKGVDARLFYLPLENHHTLKPENGIKWNEEVLGWLAKYLK